MTEMKKLSKQKGFKLVFVMDAVRETIYTGNNPDEYEAAALNKIASEEASKLDLPFLDLTTAFNEAYKSNSKKFEFPWDWHWNKNGNKVAGRTIAKFLENDAKTNPKTGSIRK